MHLYVHCDLWQLDSIYPCVVVLGIQMELPIVMVLLMDANDGCLPLTCGDADGNGNSQGNGDVMPFTL